MNKGRKEGSGDGKSKQEAAFKGILIHFYQHNHPQYKYKIQGQDLPYRFFIIINIVSTSIDLNSQPESFLGASLSSSGKRLQHVKK